MADCIKCLHKPVCDLWHKQELQNASSFQLDGCDHFRDRSQFVELPCKVGDPVYLITYCRCGKPECYQNRHCHKKETKRTPKALDGVMIQQKGKKHRWDKNTFKMSWTWEPIGTICYRVYQRPFNVSMLPYIGHKVFLTLDEAKKGLALCACSDDGKRSEDGT